MSAFTPANLNLISPIPPQKTKNSSRFAFETAAVIILLYRISDVILDYVIETGVNVVVFASDGCAPWPQPLYDQIVQLKFELLNSVST